VSVTEFRVAFVCTGNRFRSPIAAALMARETPDLPIRIASLGTLDIGRERALPEAVAIAEELGLDIFDHRARSVTNIDLERFHLVLGFERKHVMSSVVDAEALIEHTFTLPELVELLEGLPAAREPADPVERALLRVRRAHKARAPDYRRQRFPEVEDPLGMSIPDQRDTAHELEALVKELVRLLFE
jgi:low molecular weight protein-tyrosine phosphatase